MVVKLPLIFFRDWGVHNSFKKWHTMGKRKKRGNTMFCQKKKSSGMGVVALIGGMLAAVGVMSIVGMCLRHSSSTKKKLKGFASACCDGVEQAVDSTRDMMDSMGN